ncbi:MAG: mechanosensitive ion channel domain-containing protein [Chitinophagaceae bacterium]
MNDLLDRILFDNAIRDYLLLFSVILVLILFRKYLSRSIATLIFRIFHKSFLSSGKEEFVHLLKGPINVFVLMVVVFLLLDKFNYPTILELYLHHIPLRNILESFSRGVLILCMVWLILRVLDFIALLLEQRTDHTHGVSGTQLVIFFKDLLKVVVLFVGVLLLIRFTLNRNVSTLLAGFGIVGAAVALSARESLENLIASFIIFFDKPFSTGDLVKVQAITGTVERIGLRSTRIRTDQKTFVTVPNKQMVDSILDNLSLRTQRKGSVSLDLNSATSLELVNGFLAAVKDSIKDIPELEGSGSVNLVDINKNSFVVQVDYFTGPIPVEIFNSIRQRINLSIIGYLGQFGIALATKDGVI